MSFCPTTALKHLTQSNKPTGLLSCMIGAKNFMKSDKDNFVCFSFPQKKGFNYCKIRLNSMDEYELTFAKKYSLKMMLKKNTAFGKTKVFNGLPIENMKETFEETTGLYLSF